MPIRPRAVVDLNDITSLPGDYRLPPRSLRLKLDTRFTHPGSRREFADEDVTRIDLLVVYTNQAVRFGRQ